LAVGVTGEQLVDQAAGGLGDVGCSSAAGLTTSTGPPSAHSPGVAGAAAPGSSRPPGAGLEDLPKGVTAKPVQAVCLPIRSPGITGHEGTGPPPCEGVRLEGVAIAP
jgi:hypothetical protein